MTHSVPHRSERLPRWRLCALLSLITLAACARGDMSAAVPVEAPVLLHPGDFAVADSGDLRTGPMLSGTLAADRTAQLRAELTGVVADVAVRPGDHVRQGQLLLTLRVPSVSAVVTAGRTAERAAQVTAENARREVDRLRVLLAGGAISRAELEQADAQLQVALAQLDDARARRRAADLDQQRTRIVSPFSGVVLARAVNAGDNIQPGDPLLSVIDPARLALDAGVPAASAASAKVGTAITLRVAGSADTSATARVTRVLPAVDATTRQVRITATLDNSRGQYIAGAFAEGRLIEVARRAVLIPSAAVDTVNGTPIVSRITGGRVTRVVVAVGLLTPDGTTVEIRRGVQAGDTILTGATKTVAVGAPTRVVASTERAP